MSIKVSSSRDERIMATVIAQVATAGEIEKKIADLDFTGIPVTDVLNRVDEIINLWQDLRSQYVNLQDLGIEVTADLEHLQPQLIEAIG